MRITKSLKINLIKRNGDITLKTIRNEVKSLYIQELAFNLEAIKLKLSKLGYPEVGDVNTIVHKTKSFVSCAVGRITYKIMSLLYF